MRTLPERYFQVRMTTRQGGTFLCGTRARSTGGAVAALMKLVRDGVTFTDVVLIPGPRDRAAGGRQ